VVSTPAIGVLLVNIGQSSVFAAIASVSVVIGPTVPVMDLGRWGIPVNLVAVVMGGLLVINIGWLRAEIYDVAGAGWFMQYFR